MTTSVSPSNQSSNDSKSLKCSRDSLHTAVGICFMDKLPDELLLQTFTYFTHNVKQLSRLERVCKRFNIIAKDQKLWYFVFKYKYPTWSKNVFYSIDLINWRDYVIHLIKQQESTKQFSFKFINEEEQREVKEENKRAVELQREPNRKRKFQWLMEANNEQNMVVVEEEDIPDRVRPRPLLRRTFTEGDILAPDVRRTRARITAHSDNNHLHDNVHHVSTSSLRPLSHTDIHSNMQDSNSSWRPFDHAGDSDEESFPYTSSSPPLPQTELHDKTPFWIQDPLVVDIDRVTKTGVVATGKHRKRDHQSEHMILFWAYPSWKLIRKFELELVPNTHSCQIIGIQSVTLHNNQKVRLFSIAVGIPLDNPLSEQQEDRVDIWNSLFIYQLNDDGSTECLAHIKVSDVFLGREVFLFSEASWGQLNDENIIGDKHGGSGIMSTASTTSTTSKVKDWLKIISPEHIDYDPNYTIFVLAMGPVYQRITGCIQLAKFDIRSSYREEVLDPARVPCVWDRHKRELVPMKEVSMFQFYQCTSQRDRFGNPMATTQGNSTSSSSTNDSRSSSCDRPISIMKRILLGRSVSCMIHFKYPPQLNHLICTGSYDDDELSVYDWRFGLKVGSLPWKIATPPTGVDNEVESAAMNNENNINNDDLRTAAARAEAALDAQGLNVVIENDDVRQPLRGADFTMHEIEQLLGGNLRDLVANAARNETNEDNMIIEGLEREEDQQQEVQEGDEGIVTDQVDARPWGLESTFVIPAYWSSSDTATSSLADHGLRLIAVGDTRNEGPRSKLEIKIWDISYLLNVKWDPLAEDHAEQRSTQDDQQCNNIAETETKDVEADDMKGLPEHVKLGILHRFPWWPRRTKELSRLAIHMIKSELPKTSFASPFNPQLSMEKEQNEAKSFKLPYSPVNEDQSMLLCHTFDKDEQQEESHQQRTTLFPPASTDTVDVTDTFNADNRAGNIPVRYTAYNVLYTSLFLLTEDGKVTVMDIETGEITGTVNNVAEGASSPDGSRSGLNEIHGIDVNVIGGKEVVVTSKEGILRGMV